MNRHKKLLLVVLIPLAFVGAVFANWIGSTSTKHTVASVVGKFAVGEGATASTFEFSSDQSVRVRGLWAKPGDEVLGEWSGDLTSSVHLNLRLGVPGSRLAWRFSDREVRPREVAECGFRLISIDGDLFPAEEVVAARALAVEVPAPWMERFRRIDRDLK
jgi:hypothetical protein